MTVCFDSNVFIYALSDRFELRPAAADIVGRLGERNAPLPVQVIRETLAVAQRTRFVKPSTARETVAAATELFKVVPADVDDLFRASQMAERHKLQYYDALLCCTARRVGCSFLLSRDMQDGFMFGAMRIVNPFTAGNADLIQDLLA